VSERASELPPPIRGMRAAFVFLTRIPVGGFPYQGRDWTWAAAHAPLVGLVVGAAIGGVDRVLLPLGALPAALLAIAVSLLITGAFHEDGLADTSDALGGGYDRARVLAILKDPRIGSFGGVALVVSITARAALIAELGVHAPWAVSIVGCWARVAPIWLMAALPYVTPDDTAKSRDIARGGVPQAAVATAWGAAALAVAGLLGWMSLARAAALVVTIVVVALLTGWRYVRRAEGITGDFLGATEQLGEIAALAVVVWKG
jgi:adenosylcobinamide-GDP ribazoletransferase